MTDALDGETSYTYDTLGNRLSLTDPVDNTTAWVYDDLNRVIGETNQLDDTRHFEYNAAGLLTRRIDRRDRVRQFEYDNLYRNTAEIWYDDVDDANAQTNAVNTFSFTFDSAGNMVTASDDFAQYVYAHDRLGRATSITHTIDGLTPEVLFTQQFDALGRRTQLAAVIDGEDDFVTDYVYDNLGRIDTIKQQDQSGGNAVAEKYVDFAFDIAGRPELIERYANISGTQLVAESDFTFNDLGRLTDLTHAKGATTLVDYDWAFDHAGRITDFDFWYDDTWYRTTAATGDPIEYDDTGQLTDVDYDGWQSDEGYEYDANGNRTNDDYSVTTNNRMSSDGTFTYTYDAEGNRATRTRISNDAADDYLTVYTWDHRNRMTKVTFKDNSEVATKIVEYAYDFGNRWVRKILDSNADTTTDASTIFVQDNDHIGLQFDADAADLAAADLSHRYLHGTAIDQILADEQVSSLGTAGNVLWPLTDHLGTVRDLAEYNSGTDTTTIVNHRDFNAFGLITDETAPAVDHIFAHTGRPLDVDTGDQNHRGRWYGPATGGWLSPDLIVFEAGDANLYRYTFNSPLVLIDPSGLAVALPVWDSLKDGAVRLHSATLVQTFPDDKFGETRLTGAVEAVLEVVLRENRCHIQWRTFVIPVSVKAARKVGGLRLSDKQLQESLDHEKGHLDAFMSPGKIFHKKVEQLDQELHALQERDQRTDYRARAHAAVDVLNRNAQKWLTARLNIEAIKQKYHFDHLQDHLRAVSNGIYRQRAETYQDLWELPGTQAAFLRDAQTEFKLRVSSANEAKRKLTEGERSMDGNQIEGLFKAAHDNLKGR